MSKLIDILLRSIVARRFAAGTGRHFAVAAVLLVIASGAASAQTYDRVLHRNFWNESWNVTGLRNDTLSISYAEAHATAEHGGFRDYSDAKKSWNIGAEAHTIMHLPKASMAGRFSFDHTAGYDMCGSMLMEPGYYPVDVMEFTPGRKDRQKYAFAGGFSMDIAPNWRIGAGIDFASQNYAKRKDLRHTNYRLDMTVAPGFIYYMDDWSVGANYIYNKNSETATAETIGNTVGSYYAFLDKGLMYGAYELWSGSGVHLDESGVSGFPLSERSHGIAVQGTWKDLFVELEYARSKGKSGEKETIWFEFPANSVSFFAGYRFKSEEVEHVFRLNVDWKRQKNNENVLGKETENGITTTHVYGSNEIFQRNMLTVAPEYQWISFMAEFSVGAEISSLKRLSSLMYPYLFRQSIMAEKVYFDGSVRIRQFNVGFGAAFSLGSLEEEDENVDEEVAAGSAPTQLTEYYDIQNEYLTAPRVEAFLSLRWNLPYSLYVEAAAGCTHAFDVKYIAGHNRWCETLKFGYKF